MGKFTHYLVTRFNVPEARWSTDKSGQVTLDDAWFSHRLDLFRKFCVPSVAGQTEKNFNWVVYCDTQTSPDHLHEIEKALQPLPNALLRFAENQENFLTDLRHYVHQSWTPYLITTRLDNDDAISCDFIKHVQDQFDEVGHVIVNPERGIQYDLHHQSMTRIATSATNHFLSVIETMDDPESLFTAFGFHHHSIPPGFTLRPLLQDRQWLKIIHDRNVKSQLKGKPLLRFTSANQFSLPAQLFSISVLQTLWYSINRKRNISRSKE